MSFPKLGTSFPAHPTGDPARSRSRAFAEAISAALKRELGYSAIKTATGWTGTHERTVKNWLAGRSTPSGANLAELSRHSDEVLCAFLLWAGRGDLLTAKRLVSARDRLRGLLREVDLLIEG